MIVTESAISEVKRVISVQKEEDQLYLRVAVRGEGCSGFSWRLELDPYPPTERDEVFEKSGVKITVDSRSLLYAEDLKIDYVSGPTRSGFTCKNEVMQSSCACGSAD